jgi:hypothetical protein
MRRFHPSLVGLFVLLGCAALNAQPIEGYVLDRLTHAPVAGAHASTYCTNDPAVAATDAAGHFSLAMGDACPGINIVRSGYLPFEFLEVTREPGSTPTQVRVELTLQSVIAGRIVDEDGLPVEEAHVDVLRYRTLGGQRTLQPVAAGPNAGLSNDLGEYRIGGLSAGHYYVRVALMGTAGSWDARYLPQYYPAATAPEDATAIDLKAGEQRTDVHFRLQRRDGVTVAGKVDLPPGFSIVQGAWVSLEPGSGTTARVAADGKFVMAHVVPAEYTLRLRGGARSGGQWEIQGSQTLLVGPAGVSGLVVAAHVTGPQTVTGLVHFQGSAPHIPLKVAIGRWDRPFQSGDVGSDGTFRIEAVPPGPCYIHLIPHVDGASSQELPISVRVGDRPVLPWRVQLDGGPVEPLQINVLTPLLDGGVAPNLRFVDAGGQNVANVTMLFAGATTGFRVISKTNSAGVCARVRLVPDTYRVYASDEDVQYDIFDDADFLHEHANDFPPVLITSGENPPLVLTVPR